MSHYVRYFEILDTKHLRPKTEVQGKNISFSFSCLETMIRTGFMELEPRAIPVLG